MPTTSLAPAYERLVQQLAQLPGIGPRSAQRIALHLIKRPTGEALALAEAIRDFTQNLKVCATCGHVSESDPCPICRDPRRDGGLILVVEQPTDVTTLEQLGHYRGRYHVLMGRIAHLEGVGPGELNIQGLLARAEAEKPREVILGTNPTLEGDGTALYLAEALRRLGIAVSRLARGVPTGSTLQTVSKAVLSDALQGRHAM